MLTSLATDPINHVLDHKIRIREQLKFYSGQTVRIQILPIIEFTLCITAEGKFHPTDNHHKIDATLSIPSWKLPQLLIPNNNAPGVIKVSGNQTLGNEIINFIQQVNIEYFLAHELSKIIGDIPAHRVMQSNHLLHQWHQKNCKRITQSFFEFCTEEKNLFIKKSADFNGFTQEISALKNSIDQVELSINQLLQKDS
jgi:ubiquinone biosynthesis protein UbiJ